MPKYMQCGLSAIVALLAEGVGRNQTWLKLSTITHPVALLAEGVGRNIAASTPIENRTGSPSSRRAWVEMDRRGRNVPPHKSPSSRRAWVEIRRKSWKAPIPTSPSSRRAWVEIKMPNWLAMSIVSPSSRRVRVEMTRPQGVHCALCLSLPAGRDRNPLHFPSGLL